MPTTICPECDEEVYVDADSEQGDTVEDAAREANAVAALKCRSLGARTALPDESELFELIKKV